MSIFNNLKIAFNDKSDTDLRKAFIIFLLINNPIISKILIILAKTSIFLHLPIHLIIKPTIFRHFCGGTTINDSKKTINKLWESKIGSILDFSIEGKDRIQDFEKVKEETIKTIETAKNSKNIPFAVFKPTGLTKFKLLEKISNKQKLNKKEKVEKNNFITRVDEICQSAKKNKIPVFIDAEESWIQESIDDIIMKMMEKYNKKNVYVYNTLQMYRIDRMKYLNKIILDAKNNNHLLGIKLVRGAYHNQEIQRAIKNNYNIPVYTKKIDTDNNFNKAIEICCKNINYISFCAGTHNEYSNQMLIENMNKYNIKKEDKRVYFSQLLGMSDHISYNIANNGFNTAKYVPYGPVKEVLPYLIRRAEENTAIAGQMGRELRNIINEKKRRKKN